MRSLPVSDTGSLLPVSDGVSLLPVSDGVSLLPVSDTGSLLPVSDSVRGRRGRGETTCVRRSSGRAGELSVLPALLLETWGGRVLLIGL